jgi:hypothetical protein
MYAGSAAESGTMKVAGGPGVAAAAGLLAAGDAAALAVES